MEGGWEMGGRIIDEEDHFYVDWDAYQEVSWPTDARRRMDTHMLRERERLWAHCFNRVAALGHRGGQEFGPPAAVTPGSYSIFWCEAGVAEFFVVYNFVLFYDLFVSSLLGGVGVAVGRAVELVGKCIAMHRHMCCWKSLLFLCPPAIIRSSLIFFLLLHFHGFCFGTSLYFFPSFNPSLLPSCSPRSLSRVGDRSQL